MSGSAEQRKYFRLSPYVVHVKGARRGALYDLHRKRIFPIPASASYVIDLCQATGDIEVSLAPITEEADRAVAESYLQDFARLGFAEISPEASSRAQAFRVDPGDVVKRKLSVLGVELHGRDGQSDTLGADAWMDILRVARRHGPAAQLNVFLGAPDQTPDWVPQVLAYAMTLEFHHIEVIVPPGGCGDAIDAFLAGSNLALCVSDENMGASSDVASPDVDAYVGHLRGLGLRPRKARSSAIARITEASMLCDHLSYSRFRHGSLHSGCLHLHADGAAYPWRLETVDRIGHARDGSGLMALLRSDTLVRHWLRSKDDIDTCRDCEFRYACPNSYTFRSEASRVGSAPANCLYDPYAGAWTYRRDEACFSGASVVLQDESRYFRVRSLAERPFPKPYLEMLDQAAADIRDLFGLSLGSLKIGYDFYPTLEELQRDLAHRGDGLSGLTELRAGDNIGTVKSSYPCHIHEVVHALLFQWNKTPRFFVSEASATVFGRVRVAGTARAIETDMQVRIEGADGELSIEDVVVFDNDGAIVGPPLDADVHEVARWLHIRRNVSVDIGNFYDAIDERDLPGCFYEIGGSFIRWLIETRGAAVFREFYASGQKRVHFEACYGENLEALTEQWKNCIILEGRTQ